MLNESPEIMIALCALFLLCLFVICFCSVITIFNKAKAEKEKEQAASICIRYQILIGVLSFWGLISLILGIRALLSALHYTFGG